MFSKLFGWFWYMIKAWTTVFYIYISIFTSISVHIAVPIHILGPSSSLSWCGIRTKITWSQISLKKGNWSFIPIKSCESWDQSLKPLNIHYGGNSDQLQCLCIIWARFYFFCSIPPFPTGRRISPDRTHNSNNVVWTQNSGFGSTQVGLKFLLSHWSAVWSLANHNLSIK